MRQTLLKMSMVLSTLLIVQKSLYAGEDGIVSNVGADASADRRIMSMERLVLEKRHLSDHEKLACVNRFFNQIPYQSDVKNWGKNDHWATPVELLTKGKGDCEDYAIAKFYTLLDMGIPQEKLYLTYVKLSDKGEPHLMLTYYASEDAQPVVLDNRTLQMQEGLHGKDYEPLYRFNLKTFVTMQNGKERVYPKHKVTLKKWDTFCKRMSI